jgi:hypothetical protein
VILCKRLILLARPKRFELLTPRFVVKSSPWKSQAIFANYIQLVTRDDNGLHRICKPFRPVQALPAISPGNAKSTPTAQHHDADDCNSHSGQHHRQQVPQGPLSPQGHPQARHTGLRPRRLKQPVSQPPGETLIAGLVSGPRRAQNLLGTVPSRWTAKNGTVQATVSA